MTDQALTRFVALIGQVALQTFIFVDVAMVHCTYFCKIS